MFTEPKSNPNTVQSASSHLVSSLTSELIRKKSPAPSISTNSSELSPPSNGTVKSADNYR